MSRARCALHRPAGLCLSGVRRMLWERQNEQQTDPSGLTAPCGQGASRRRKRLSLHNNDRPAQLALGEMHVARWRSPALATDGALDCSTLAENGRTIEGRRSEIDICLEQKKERRSAPFRSVLFALRQSSACTISSHIFFASENSIIVLSLKKSSLSTPA